MGFPGGSNSKESICNVGDLSSIPGLRRSPEEGNGNLLQYSCLENPMGRGLCQACSPWGCKESDTSERLHFTLPPQLSQGEYLLCPVSWFSWPIPSTGFFLSLGYDQTRMEECRRPAKSTKEGKAEGKWDNLYCFFFPVTRIAQSKWPMIYSVEMNDEYTHSDSLNIIQKCLFNTL